MSELTYSPGQVAKRLGVPDRTLRFWSTRFADWLTPSAVAVSTGKGSRHRRYTDADLAVLTQIQRLAARNISLREIEHQLGPRRSVTARAVSIAPEHDRLSTESTVDRHEDDTPAMSSSELDDVVDDTNETHDETMSRQPDREAAVAGTRRLDADQSLSGPIHQPSDKPAEREPGTWSHRPMSDLRQLPESDLGDRLTRIEQRLALIESMLIDLTAKLASTASDRPRRRWWWPFGRKPAEQTAIGRRIARLAAERMLTRHDLAARARLPLTTVQAILTGRATPEPAEIAALAAALEVEEPAITGRS